MALSLLAATFSLPLAPVDIPRWRGAWAELAGYENDRYHNHRPGENGTYYRYPLIQYRINRRHAALLALNEGVLDVQRTLAETNWELSWKQEPYRLSIRDLRLETFDLGWSSELFTYRLYNYLPLNDDNYRRYQAAPDLFARLTILKELLAGHLLAFAQGVNWQIPERFEITLIDLLRQRRVMLHDIQRPAFDLIFRTELCLPRGIGLGKGVSHGFGQLVPLRNNELSGDQEE